MSKLETVWKTHGNAHIRSVAHLLNGMLAADPKSELANSLRVVIEMADSSRELTQVINWLEGNIQEIKKNVNKGEGK